MSTVEERRERAVAKIREIWGPEEAAKKGILREMHPEFAKLSEEVLFGAVWGDPVLETRTRSFITLAALTVLDRQPELRIHIRGALNLGIPREQILAVFTHLAFYGGMPVTLNAVYTAKQVFQKWDAERKKLD